MAQRSKTVRDPRGAAGAAGDKQGAHRRRRRRCMCGAMTRPRLVDTSRFRTSGPLWKMGELKDYSARGLFSGLQPSLALRSAYIGVLVSSSSYRGGSSRNFSLAFESCTVHSTTGPNNTVC